MYSFFSFTGHVKIKKARQFSITICQLNKNQKMTLQANNRVSALWLLVTDHTHTHTHTLYKHNNCYQSHSVNVTAAVNTTRVSHVVQGNVNSFKPTNKLKSCCCSIQQSNPNSIDAVLHHQRTTTVEGLEYNKIIHKPQ